MRFGLNVGTSAAPGRDPVREAQSAEALGFDFVSATDHLHGVSPTYETWTMLAWVAAGTSRRRSPSVTTVTSSTRSSGQAARRPSTTSRL